MKGILGFGQDGYGYRHSHAVAHRNLPFFETSVFFLAGTAQAHAGTGGEEKEKKQLSINNNSR
jgi:hypothetical protein